MRRGRWEEVADKGGAVITFIITIIAMTSKSRQRRGFRGL
jgi:hypothetical protein